MSTETANSKFKSLPAELLRFSEVHWVWIKVTCKPAKKSVGSERRHFDNLASLGLGSNHNCVGRTGIWALAAKMPAWRSSERTLLRLWRLTQDMRNGESALRWMMIPASCQSLQFRPFISDCSHCNWPYCCTYVAECKSCT